MILGQAALAPAEEIWKPETATDVSSQTIPTKLSARRDTRSEETREVHVGIDLLLNDKMILEAEFLKTVHSF